MSIHILEFTKIPARNLGHNVVKSRFKAGCRRFSHCVLQAWKRMAETNLRSNECQWIAGCFGSKGTTGGVARTDCWADGTAYLERLKRAFTSMTMYSNCWGSTRTEHCIHPQRPNDE